MGRNREGMVEEILAAIRPPRIEDAGLEVCALPPDSIMEAFSRAAASLKSVVVGDDGSDGGKCVQDLGPSNGEIPDELVDTSEGLLPGSRFCGLSGDEADRAGSEDEVVVAGTGVGEWASDSVVIAGAGEEEEKRGESELGCKRDCAEDGELLPGMDAGCGLREDDERKDEPILVEDLI
ncbi:hypothetical protein AXF42_Ash009552 [Apostasia shenzhenica]|uniref:Uncharacterized protein n=1 Tax=Apostasia shenzhenica TaxID=1088818 RepID=A0A2I0B9A1_9ASPA|nr:hypothetical protein AXF42_Ash009552 [Apostasia shenzhenica]